MEFNQNSLKNNFFLKLMNSKMNKIEKVKFLELKCENCGTTQEIPIHCKQPMHIEGDILVCHMGSHCGSQDIPMHCGKLMIIK